MSDEWKPIWVTLQAHDEGIVEGFLVEEHCTGGASVRCPGKYAGFLVVNAEDWHPTREAALARAEEMRAAKIASLKRQIERLESLEF